MAGSSQPKHGYQVPNAESLRIPLESFRLSSGETLTEASEQHLLVMVFLRHFGCTFTRQILKGLQQLENQAMSRGARLVLVHMLGGGKEVGYIGQDHPHVVRISDPDCELYRAFGLGKGSFWELFGPRVWWLAMFSVFKGCGIGRFAGDGMQMPGVFLLHRGEILSAMPARSAADLPDLPALFAAIPRSQSTFLQNES